jgi:hypothetical protein
MIKLEEIVPMEIESSFVVYIFVGFYAHWPHCTLGGRYYGLLHHVGDVLI